MAKAKLVKAKSKKNTNTKDITKKLKCNFMKIIKILFFTVTVINACYSPHLFGCAQDGPFDYTQDRQKKEVGQKVIDERLIDAARAGDITKVQQLLKDTSIDINAKDQYGRTALMWASFHDSKEIVELLLNHPNIDINIIDDCDENALTWASFHGNKEIVELLEKYQNEYLPYKNKRTEELKKINEALPNILSSSSFPKVLIGIVQEYANDFMTFSQFLKEEIKFY